MIKILVTTAAVIIVSVQTGFAAQISVMPSLQTVSKGDNFTVNITIDPEGSEVFGAQYELQFDNSLLSVTSQAKGPFFGGDASVLKNELNNTMGWVKYGETRTKQPAVSNQGILATITFTAIESGTCSLNLSEVKLSDPNAQPISDVSVNNGTCEIEAIQEQTPASTPTPAPTHISNSGSGGSGNGGASVTPTPTPTPTSSPARTQTPGLTPEPTATPAKTPVTILSPDSAITSVVTSSPTPVSTPAASEEERKLPGFEAMATLITLLMLYTVFKFKIRKGGDRDE